MKKYLAVLAILAMLVGCAPAASTTTDTTTTTAGAINTVQTIACDPPAAVIAILPAAISLIMVAVSTFVPGSAAYLAAVNASTVANLIETGICVSVTQLNSLIAFLQSGDVKTIQTKAMVKAGPMKAKALNVTPLQDWANTLK